MDLRDLRKSNGYSQKNLGVKAEVGQDTISNIENFKQEMSLNTAINLSPFLGNIDPLKLCLEQSRGILLKRLSEAEKIKSDGISTLGSKSLSRLIKNLIDLSEDEFVLNDMELANKLFSFAIKIFSALKQIKNIREEL